MTATAQTFSMTIDGKPVTSAESLAVINPATEAEFARVPRAGQAELDQAVAAAQKAFPGWKAQGMDQRKQLLKAMSSAMKEHADALAELFTLEQGRPLALAKEEVLLASFWLKSMTAYDLPVEVTEDSDTRRVEVHREPLGVVCAIVPWNFPVLLACWKISHALLTGNTMVLKPSPFTPLTALKMAEIWRDILPAGVFNVITGGDELGPMMTRHPGFAKISFTGSTATGKRIMESAAADLKRITLELGGNDACIVLPDVDVEAIAQDLFMGAFYNTAQVCIATKRLYIHASIYDELRDKLHKLAKVMPVGNGMDKGMVFGPLQNKPQYLRVKALIDEAKASGLTVLEGGAVPDTGYFLPFTLVDNPPDDAPVVTEEAFGPVLPLLKYESIGEVVERANASDYGLAGAVWSNDIDQAVAVAHRLETGTVWINQNLQTLPHTPLGGHKQSGIGVENGLHGLLEFTQTKAIYIPKPAKEQVAKAAE